MKNNKSKHSIYLRVFSAFLATYMVLMIGFSFFIISQEKEAVIKELGSYSMQISRRVEEILNDNIDENNQITDIVKVKKEFVKNQPAFTLTGAESAIFTSNYKLIYNTNDYWKCSYTEDIERNDSEGNKYIARSATGLLNPKDWFSEAEVKELENYLNAEPNAKKVGDLYRYSLTLDGFWMKDEMIIPNKIYVTSMYADEFDGDGNVTSSSGTRQNNLVYSTGYENAEGLPYFSGGGILPYTEYGYTEKSDSKINSKNQEELRQMVTNESKLKSFLQNSPQSIHFIEPIERLNWLTYRYYLVVPYKSGIKIMEDNSLYSEFWTAVGTDINIWERISSTLAYVWISCLIIFIIAAYILSRQTYKNYLKQEELERQRKEMTDAMAHDLKTPLSIISGYAQNLQEDVHTEKREHYASHIQANVYRMDKIIKKMLEMSKLDSESFEMKFEDVSIYEISNGIINRYKNICDEKSIKTYITGEAVIKADKALIERVIDNFFVNALDNMHEGGTISISIQADTFEIYNSGSHIPEDIIVDIWLPYKKGNVERSNTKGSGLGLSIVRTILELHKFPYGVKNNEDSVTFWFKFK